mmetsp:Transcript_13134/g.43514  ORF Transcript_13134/g.43514 Transcript_13134/m.43514 type:complete len:305 (+) Transcript_13134:2121-3035(+)
MGGAHRATARNSTPNSRRTSAVSASASLTRWQSPREKSTPARRSSGKAPRATHALAIAPSAPRAVSGLTHTGPTFRECDCVGDCESPPPSTPPKPSTPPSPNPKPPVSRETCTTPLSRFFPSIVRPLDPRSAFKRCTYAAHRGRAAATTRSSSFRKCATPVGIRVSVNKAACVSVCVGGDAACGSVWSAPAAASPARKHERSSCPTAAVSCAAHTAASSSSSPTDTACRCAHTSTSRKPVMSSIFWEWSIPFATKEVKNAQPAARRSGLGEVRATRAASAMDCDCGGFDCVLTDVNRETSIQST